MNRPVLEGVRLNAPAYVRHARLLAEQNAEVERKNAEVEQAREALAAHRLQDRPGRGVGQVGLRTPPRQTAANRQAAAA